MYLLYLHRRKTDNIVFYVGIGNSKRPYIKNTRSSFWKNEVQKHDYTIEILTDNLSWSNAQESEIRLIRLYGRRDLGLGTLVNLTDGGDGSPGVIQSEESKLKKSLATKGKRLGPDHHLYGTKRNPELIIKRFGKDNWMYGKDIFKGSKSPCAKKVINIITNQKWDCLGDCALENNIKKSTLTAWLNGQNKNKSNFRFS